MKIKLVVLVSKEEGLALLLQLVVRTEEGTNPTASNLQHGLKRSCNVDMDYAETSKKESS